MNISSDIIFKFHYDSINSMKELEMKEDLNEFKFHYDSINSACNGDWNAYQGLVTGAALQWDNTNLNINIGLSSDTNGVVRINFMIYRKLN